MIRKLLATAGAALLLPLAIPAQPASAADIPCPKPNVAPPAGRPPTPVPPPDNPENSRVGGDALATHGLIIPAGARQPPAVMASTWIVADLDTGEVLGACGPHVYRTPASVLKTVLAATVMDELKPDQTVTVAPSDLKIEENSSAVGILPGGRYPVSALWLGLLLNSGNDAANALARVAGGGGEDGVDKTVAAENAFAQSLGAYQTHVVHPSGLDGAGQFTSAYDLALMARVNFDRPAFVRYALTRAAQMPAQPQLKKAGFQFQNENKLIFNYPGALGGKTGYTTVARHSYVGAAQRGGRRLVVTLLGSEARPIRGWQQGELLLDWGFAQPKGASVGHLVTPQEVATAKQQTEAATQAPGATARPVAAPGRTSSSGSDKVLLAVAAALLLAAAPLLLLITLRRRGQRRVG